MVRLLTRFYEKPVDSLKLSIGTKQLILVFGLMAFLMIYIYPIFYSQGQLGVSGQVYHNISGAKAQ